MTLDDTWVNKLKKIKKNIIEIIPTSNNEKPLSDVNGGNSGKSADYAKSDHQHPLSTAYASSSHTHSNATQSANGLMSSSDKTKLDGIATSANNYSHPSYTARTGKPTANQTPGFGQTATVSQIKSDSSGHVTEANDYTIKIPNATATTSAAGLMSSTDKTKLDGVATGANKTTVDSSMSSSSTNPVQNKIVNSAIDAKTVTVEKQSTAETGFVATYVVKQNGTQVGEKINIPKDFLVKSASLKTCTTANSPLNGLAVNDPYLDFVVNVKEGASATDEHIYINVKDLVDTYTAGTGLTLSNGQFSLTDASNYVKKSSTSGYIKNDGTIGTPPNTTYSAATQSAAGLMSAADKQKLDGMASGGNTATDHNHDGSYIKTGTGTVTSTNIADGTIVNGDIANTTIQGGKLVNGTITATQLASNAVETAKIKDANVTNAKLADQTNTVTEYIVGTQTASTSAWTGKATKISSLAAGQVIYYKLPYASKNTAVTLNLTLADGTTTTGAKEVWFWNGSRVTTNYGVNSVIGLVYNGSQWWVINPSNNNTNNVLNGANYFTTGEALTTNNLIACKKEDGKYYKINTLKGLVIDVSKPILIANGSLNADQKTANSIIYHPWISPTNLNGGTSLTLSSTTYQPVYLEGTGYSNGEFTVSTTPITQTLTNGRFYIMLGVAYATNGMGIDLTNQQVLYCYNGALIPSTSWNSLVNKPSTFTPSSHTHTKSNITDFPTSMTPTAHTDSNGAYGKATTSVWGHTKLNSATNSTDETTAATPKAVKAAYDLANGKPSLGTTSTTAAKGDHNHDGVYLKSYTPPTASTSQAGIVQLSDSTSTTSSTVAATSTAVKAAYDKGNHSHPYISTTAGSVGASNLASNAVEEAKIKDGNVTNAKLADQSNIVTEYIVGTHGTTATNVWTGTSTKINSLSAGQVIFFKMTSAGTSSAATLNLTLANGTTTGAKNIRYNSATNLTTHFPQNTVLELVYDGTYWVCTAIQNTNNYDRVNSTSNIVNGESSEVAAYTLMWGKTDKKYYKIAKNGVFNIRYPIVWLAGKVASGSATNNVYSLYSGVNLQNTISGKTVTTNQQVYVEGTAFSNGNFTVSSKVFVSEGSLTSGRYYVPIGQSYSTTNIRLNATNQQVYYYDGTNLKPVEDYKYQPAGSYAASSHTHDYSGTYAPKTHTHGNITNDGKVTTTTSTVGNVMVTDGSNIVKVINKLPAANVTHQDISGKANKTNGASQITDNNSANYEAIEGEANETQQSLNSKINEHIAQLQQDTSNLVPTDHSSSGQNYGLATASKYGHAKIVTNLTTEDANGLVLGAGQGKALKTAVDGKAPTSHTNTGNTATYGKATASVWGHTKAGSVVTADSIDGAVGTDNGFYARADHQHKQSYLYAEASHNHTMSNITDWLNKVYPIGAIYMSVDSTSPATLFGGEWQQLTETFLYASTTADTGTTATAGSKDAITIAHSHKPSATTKQFLVANPGSSTAGVDKTGSKRAYTETNNNGIRYLFDRDSSLSDVCCTNTVGDDGTGKNMPPYMKVYMWKRTA